MQHAEILARRAEGWVWLDDRVPVEEAYDEVGQAVDAGLQALEAEIEAGRLSADEAAELAADARFELGANEHHLGGQDSEAIEALVSFEDRIRERA
jgi:hypothetical protein